MGLFAAANALPTPAAALLPSFAFNRGILSFPSSLPASYGLEGLKAWYGSADPLHPAIFFATGMSVVVWLLGEITGTSSRVLQIGGPIRRVKGRRRPQAEVETSFRV